MTLRMYSIQNGCVVGADVTDNEFKMLHTLSHSLVHLDQ